MSPRDGFAPDCTHLLAGVVGYGLLLRPFLVISVGVGGLVLVPAWFGWAALLLRSSPSR